MHNEKKIEKHNDPHLEKLLELSTLKQDKIRMVQDSLSEKLKEIDKKFKPAQEWIERHKPEGNKEFPEWLEQKETSTNKTHLGAEYLQLRGIVTNYGNIKDLAMNMGGEGAKQKYIELYDSMSAKATELWKGLECSRLKHLCDQVEILYKKCERSEEQNSSILQEKMKIIELVSQKGLYSDLNKTVNDLSTKEVIISEIDKDAKALAKAINSFKQEFNEKERIKYVDEFGTKYGYKLILKGTEDMIIRNYDDYRDSLKYVNTTKQCFYESVDQYKLKEQELKTLEELQKNQNNSKEKKEIGNRIFSAIEDTLGAMNESISYGRDALFVEGVSYKYILTNFLKLKKEYDKEYNQVKEVVDNVLESVRMENKEKLSKLESNTL